MEAIRQSIDLSIYVMIVGLTLVFFSFFSKRFKDFTSLLFLVLTPTWGVVAIIQGIGYHYFDNSNMLSTLRGFALLLAETLPILIVFGGTTFIIKYFKYKKTSSK